METMFMNIVLDPLVALVGILVPLGVAYVILTLPMRFQNEKLERQPDHDAKPRN